MAQEVQRIKSWWTRRTPLQQDALIALALYVFFCAHLLVITHFGGDHDIGRANPNAFAHSVDLGPIWLLPPYRTALAIGFATLSCAVLIFRRRFPWTVLVISTALAAIYTVLPLYPVLIFAAPMIAVYTVASGEKRNTKLLIGFLFTVAALCVITITYSTGRRTIELVGYVTLVVVAALFGSVNRSNRDYLHAVEQRALEAERTREEEARRRVESERVHIAREVHDIVAHSLSIVTVQAAAADALIDTDPAQAHKTVGIIRTTSKEALGEIRSMIDVLRGEFDDEETPFEPTASLAQLTDVVERVESAGIGVILHSDLPAQMPASVSISAYRIIQEALTNVIRHSNATQVEITAGRRGDALAIRICDNGIFDPTALENGGHGLQGMRERCDALGGTFSAAPTEMRGAHEAANFCIAVSLPLE